MHLLRLLRQQQKKYSKPLKDIVPLLITPIKNENNIDDDTLKKAAVIDGIIGFKDSSGNMIKFHEYIRVMKDYPEFSPTYRTGRING